MEKTASVRKFPQPMKNQIKAFKDGVYYNQISETVMNHLKQLNREDELKSQAATTG